MRVHLDALRRHARAAKLLRAKLAELGIEVGHKRALDITAQAYGYASYSEIQAVTGTRPADPWDEDAEPSVASARRKRQAAALAAAGVPAERSAEVAAALGLSARKLGEAAGARPPSRAEDLASLECEIASQDALRQIWQLAIPSTSAHPDDGVFLTNGWLLVRDGAWPIQLPPGSRRPEKALIVPEHVVSLLRAGPGETATLLGGDHSHPWARAMLRRAFQYAGACGAEEITFVHERISQEHKGTILIDGADMTQAIDRDASRHLGVLCAELVCRARGRNTTDLGT